MKNQRDPHDEPTRMAEVSHTNPYTSESMGSVFEHGVTVIADGGKRDAAPEAADDAPEAAADDDEAAAASEDEGDGEDGTQMKDVSHEAPEGGHGNRMFERVGDTADVVDEE